MQDNSSNDKSADIELIRLKAKILAQEIVNELKEQNHDLAEIKNKMEISLQDTCVVDNHLTIDLTDINRDNNSSNSNKLLANLVILKKYIKSKTPAYKFSRIAALCKVAFRLYKHAANEDVEKAKQIFDADPDIFIQHYETAVIELQLKRDMRKNKAIIHHYY
jgi:hypothetical protein